MIFPESLLQKYLTAFDELIAEGEAIHADIKTTREPHHSFIMHTTEYTTRYEIDWPRFVEWRTKCLSLLTAVILPGNAHRHAVENLASLSNKKDHLEYAISFLKGIRHDLDKGFLDDIQLQMEAELASDYMGQAEQLLEEGQAGKFDHVPAAVLSGAVLEQALRAMCARQTPPIPIRGAKGRPLMVNDLIVSLKKMRAFNEATAKQLQAWAAIRNHAAHGEFHEFARADVGLMLKGVRTFLAEHTT